MSQETTQAWLERIAQTARRADVFDRIAVTADALVCRARHVESEADYRVTIAGPTTWVGLFTPDRWLSESIEAELMHVGDKIEDLLEEELVDQGYDRGALPVEHFRNDEKLFVFRSPLPGEVSPQAAPSAQTAAQVLLAYEACFRELGDMKPADETV